MSLKLFFIIVAVVLEVICVFIFSEEELKRRGQGRRMLRLFYLLETGTVKITNWRANADVKKEITGIKVYSGWAALATFCLVFLALLLKVQFIAFMLFPFFIIFLLGYASIEWTFNQKRYAILYGALLILTPLAVAHSFSEGAPEYENISQIALQLARVFGYNYSDASLSLTMVVTMITFLFIYVLTTIMLSVISFAIVSMLWVTSKSSSFFVRKFDRNVVWYTAVWVQIVYIVLGGVINMM